MEEAEAHDGGKDNRQAEAHIDYTRIHLREAAVVACHDYQPDIGYTIQSPEDVLD